MQICIPVVDDRGLESHVCDHFGSSPAFVIVDTETGACRPVSNSHTHREHGSCAPLAALFELGADAFVVGGIGRGALGRIEASGAQVFRAQHTTVGETLEAFRAGTLRPASLDDACAGHNHAHGQHHEHGHHHGQERGGGARACGGAGDR